MKAVSDEYFEALLGADAPAATELLDEAIVRGASPVRLIREVIGHGQHEIGEGWADGSLSIADEHAATSVSEEALAVVSQSLPPSPHGRSIVLACPEGEWHSMPARLAGAQARAAGLQVTMLGGSLPAEHLRTHLLRTEPDALALSVTLTSNLVEASKSIKAAYRAGVPVIVGGAAWGADGSRARALGAHEWLNDARELSAAVDRAVTQETLVGSPRLAPDALLLADAPSHLAVQALERHVAGRRSAVALSAKQARERLLDYTSLMKHTASAIACGDPSILADMLERWATSLARRAFDPHWAVAACDHLAAVTETAAPQGSAMLRNVGEQHRVGRFRGAPLAVVDAPAGGRTPVVPMSPIPPLSRTALR